MQPVAVVVQDRERQLAREQMVVAVWVRPRQREEQVLPLRVAAADSAVVAAAARGLAAARALAAECSAADNCLTPIGAGILCRSA